MWQPQQAARGPSLDLCPPSFLTAGWTSDSCEQRPGTADLQWPDVNHLPAFAVNSCSLITLKHSKSAALSRCSVSQLYKLGDNMETEVIFLGLRVCSPQRGFSQGSLPGTCYYTEESIIRNINILCNNIVMYYILCIKTLWILCLSNYLDFIDPSEVG